MTVSDNDSGSATEGSNSEWEGWVDDEEEVKCLACDVVLSSVKNCTMHMETKHEFDFLKLRKSLKLDDYNTMKIINFMRGNNTLILPEDLSPILTGEQYLKPTLENDPMLYFDYDDLEEKEANNEIDETIKLKQYIAVLQSQIKQLSDANKEISARAQEYIMNMDDRSSNKTKTTTTEKAEPMEGGVDRDQGYKDSYSCYAIHEAMLKDRVRTDSYRDAMYKNQDFFKDKIVVDIGCGTGILSMFAAKAGAKHVYGIDFSETAKAAKKHVIENGFESQITIIQGKVEEIEIPDKADIIISEWMGYFLLYESMLETVLNARDRFLKPGGVVLPDQSSMYIAALEYCTPVEFWNEVYGFKMNAMKEQFTGMGTVVKENNDHIISDKAIIHNIDITNMKQKETSFVNDFTLLCTKDATCRGFISYFDILFDAGMENPVYFSTGPDCTRTHWEQTIFSLKTPVDVHAGDSIIGSISCSKNINHHRSVDVVVEYLVKDNTGRTRVPKTAQSFLIE